MNPRTTPLLTSDVPIASATQNAIRAITDQASRTKVHSVRLDDPHTAPYIPSTGRGVQPATSTKDLRRKHTRATFEATSEVLIEEARNDNRSPATTVVLDIIKLDHNRLLDAPQPWTNADTSETVQKHPQQLATLTALTPGHPIILDARPLDHANQETPSASQVVRALLNTAQEHIPVEAVIASRAFHSSDALKEIDQRGLDYLIRGQETPLLATELQKLRRLGVTEYTVDPEITVTDAQNGEFITTNVVYAPTGVETNGDDFAPFLTNRDDAIEHPEEVTAEFEETAEVGPVHQQLRTQVLERALYQSQVHAEDYYLASAEVNAYHLTQVLAHDRDAGGDCKVSFGAFVAALEAARLGQSTTHAE